ncbi:tyrosine-protein phosphatase [Leucobacter sp. CSA2]|uniref:Tyrosine-protein phosphatase n=1 Tax=Leucobacter edaphi TaxID=2796472 RepID=A0A934UWH3_9MICO|nr:tyrosine-protein phosphatase [Leucobacter edaphi]MBK0420965.1 tyrosine-protein phosphatase [Leucobacter edaphi]
MANAPLPIAGTWNLRDLGGYRADGGSIRPGAFYRSDALARIGEPGRAQLAELGIARVIDLRDDSERAFAPDDVDGVTELLAHPIFPSAGAHVARRLDVFSLTEIIYLEHADTLIEALRLLGGGAGDLRPAGATLFHCTAGKDRTGAVAALALLAAGVDRDDVVDDYVASEANLRGAWLEAHLELVRQRGLEITPEIRGLIGSTPARAIENALDAVETRFGSVRDYLRAHGMTDAELATLHAAFVA